MDRAFTDFYEALNNRRRTWVFDWMLAIAEHEIVTSKYQSDFRGHESVSKIRAALSDLQTRMVSDTNI